MPKKNPADTARRDKSREPEPVQFDGDDWEALGRLGVSRDSLGSLLPPFPTASPGLRRKKSHRRLDDEYGKIASFVFGAPEYSTFYQGASKRSLGGDTRSRAFDELVSKTLQLLSDVNEHSEAPGPEFAKACRNLQIQPSTSPDQALLSLFKRGLDSQSRTIKYDYGVIVREVEKDRIRESIISLLKVFHDLQEIPGIPVDLTPEELEACSESLAKGKNQLEKGLRKKTNPPFFPDANVWKPIRESLYFSSVAGIKNEVKLMLLNAEIKDNTRSSSDGLLGPILDLSSVVQEGESSLAAGDLREERLALTRLVCQIFYQVRTTLQHTESFTGEHLQVVVDAHKKILDMFSHFARVEKKHAETNDQKGKKKAGNPSTSTSASLRHTPTSRRLLGYGPVSYLK
ncbi:hypothetical protein JCM3765_004316 [Sporobolomyces pararoseus]